jgi:Tol biopolymer transport system component
MDVWLMAADGAAPTQVTFSGGTQARWSADGTSLTFVRGRALLQRRVDGTGAERTMFVSPQLASLGDWSADGRLYVVREVPTVGGSGIGTLWLVPATPGATATPLSNPETRGFNGRFSPDGKWVAYNSDDSGITEVYVQRIPSDGVKWKISQNGGVRPRWRRDGKEIFFIETGNVNGAGRLMAAPVELGTSVRVSASQPIVEVPFVPANANNYPYSVSADGQRILVIQSADDADRLAMTIVLNWTALLRKN